MWVQFFFFFKSYMQSLGIKINIFRRKNPALPSSPDSADPIRAELLLILTQIKEVELNNPENSNFPESHFTHTVLHGMFSEYPSWNSLALTKHHSYKLRCFPSRSMIKIEQEIITTHSLIRRSWRSPFHRR